VTFRFTLNTLIICIIYIIRKTGCYTFGLTISAFLSVELGLMRRFFMTFIHAVIYFTISSIKIIIRLSCQFFSLHSSPFYLLVFFHLIILYLCMGIFLPRIKSEKYSSIFLVRFYFILLYFVACKKKEDDFEHLICQAT